MSAGSSLRLDEVRRLAEAKHFENNTNNQRWIRRRKFSSGSQWIIWSVTSCSTRISTVSEYSNPACRSCLRITDGGFWPCISIYILMGDIANPIAIDDQPQRQANSIADTAVLICMTCTNTKEKVYCNYLQVVNYSNQQITKLES